MKNFSDQVVPVMNYKQDRLNGMDSDASEPMAPDEMYLMLQADMLSIKRQEQALQTDIDEIAAKFRHLLANCGLDANVPVPVRGDTTPPPTPSFMRTSSTSSLTHVTNMASPTFLKMSPRALSSYSNSTSEESLFLSNLIPAPMCSLADSEVTSSDGVPHDISSKTLVMDNNSNYLELESTNTDNTPVIDAFPCMETSDSTNSSGSSNTSSDRVSSTSDGYPKSSDDSDNQIVPECYDLDKEFMSRLQYYSDFTIDRQRKINSVVSQMSTSIVDDSHHTATTEELFTRHVEGAESSFSPKRVNMRSSKVITSSSDSQTTPKSASKSRRSAHLNSRSSRNRTASSRTSRKSTSNPLASSTMIDSSFSSSNSARSSHRSSGSGSIPIASSTMLDETFLSSGSENRPRSTNSCPRATSTMLDESFLSHGSSQRRSTPIANSTMLSEVPVEMPVSMRSAFSQSSIHSTCNNDNDDLESIYTWSIKDEDSCSEDMNLEESYLRNIHGQQTQRKNSNAAKPPLPPSKRLRSGSSNSVENDCNIKPTCPQEHNVHQLLGESCVMEAISAIEPSTTCRDGVVCTAESLYEDEDLQCKSSTLPRTSTRLRLQDKSSGSSSMEARRASLPDLTSVQSQDNQSVPDSSNSSPDSSPLQERLELPGRSSSSADKDSFNVSSPPTAPTAPDCSPATEGLVDTILTDSPNSICSSGIFAPQNSPGTNCSSSSKVSCSTTTSGSSNLPRAPPSSIVCSPRVPPTHPDSQPEVDQNDNSVFKVPKQTQPLRKLFRFKRNKCKTPDNMKTSTPKPENTLSVHSDPVSKRQLFPFATNSAKPEARLMDKKAVIKKFKMFSDNFHKRDKSAKVKIETLANL